MTAVEGADGARAQQLAPPGPNVASLSAASMEEQPSAVTGRPANPAGSQRPAGEAAPLSPAGPEVRDSLELNEFVKSDLILNDARHAVNNG